MMIRNTLALLLALFVSQMFGETTNEVSHCNYLLRENDVTDDAANRFVSKLMSKMTYEEIKMVLVLEAEGATIDKGGIIHAKSE